MQGYIPDFSDVNSTYSKFRCPTHNSTTVVINTDLGTSRSTSPIISRQRTETAILQEGYRLALPSGGNRDKI